MLSKKERKNNEESNEIENVKQLIQTLIEAI
jgi:hypothetical protein